MSIAIVGWGSLIWRPTSRGATIQLRTPGLWGCDGPVLPVEFARISKDGSLTLVLLDDYPCSVTTLWSVSALDDAPDAVSNLAEREGISELDWIHGVRRNGSHIGSVEARTASNVHQWLSQRPGLEAAIWTGLDAADDRWRDRGYEDGFSVDSALSYLQSLKGDPIHPAFEYIRKAPGQIDTPLRRRARSAGMPV